MSHKITHLQLIQGVINRLAGNSFLVKGWSVSLVSALFALAATKTDELFIFLAYFPVVSFWFLDGYFLYQERLFRDLYNKVRELDEGEIDYSMDTREFNRGWIGATFSNTLCLFHGAILGAVILIMVLFMNGVLAT